MQCGKLCAKMKNRFRLILIGLVVLTFAGSFLPITFAQKKVFSHSTPAHKEGKYKDCSSCHTLPTKNWESPRSDKLGPFPDVVTFPSHTSCFGCHNRDIYSNGGAFCGTCHVVPTMRAREVLAFPIKSHSHQFTTIFPHDVHQDIIASNYTKADVAVAHFVLASFGPDDNKQQFNNCAICHQTPTDLPRFMTRPPKTTVAPLADAAADNFEPKAGFFKDMPTGHASCFSCHYQGVKQMGVNPQVAGSDCASCHRLADKPYTPSNVLLRYSLKFNHQDKDHVNKDCTVCHVRIVQNSDVQKMKDADVPYIACAACHGDKLTEEAGKRADSEKNKQPAFQCTYCHTSALGRFPIPASHH